MKWKEGRKKRNDREKRERTGRKEKEGGTRREERKVGMKKGEERNSLLPMGDFYGLGHWEDRRRRSTTSLTFTETAPEQERLMASS